MSYDVIIAGAGGMGSAAAYHLARRGRRVLVLERFGLLHDRGSSHGLTRIIRLAYFEDPAYVPLLRRAYELWRDLEVTAQERLLWITGGLDVGWEGSKVFEGSLRSCTVHQLPHRVLKAQEIRQTFPAWAPRDDALAVWQPEAGFLAAERCIAAHATLARSLGAEIREHEPVTSWRTTSSGCLVETANGTYEAEQFVIAAGAWTGTLAPALRPFLTPERQVLGWFEIMEPRNFLPERFPVFILDVDEGWFYGFPVHSVPGFKIGKYHHRYEVVDPDTVNRAVEPQDETALRQCVARYFPSANGRLLSSTTCLFTNTPDEHFVIDRDPQHPQVLLVSPCSGHGFKFCSVVGEIVADLVTGDRTTHDISLFRMSRLRG